MTHRPILTCLFLLTLIPLSANAFPPSSPAGGNYLVLDGVTTTLFWTLKPSVHFYQKARTNSLWKRGYTLLHPLT